MTQTTSAGHARRSGALGVHSIDHFSLIVPDLAEAKSFYETFGLEARDQSDGLSLYVPGNPERWIALVKGPRKQLRYVSFGAFADDLPRFRERLENMAIPQIAPLAAGSDGLWFRTPDGVAVQIRAAEKRTPDTKVIGEIRSTPAGVVGTRGRKQAGRVHPRRLSHVALFSPDVPRSIKFFEDVLGLELSDRSLDIVAFLHGIHGSDHHIFALVKSDGPGFHHCAWDVATIEDVGLGAMQMADKGYTAGWGFGRHVLGSNYFHYVRDPWGSYSEYSADIDYIPADMEWKAGEHAPEDSMFLWGPNPPPDFVTNFETA